MKMLRTLRMLLLMLLPPPRPPFTLPLFGSVQRGAVDQSEHLAASQAPRGEGREGVYVSVCARARPCVQDVVCPLRAANRLMRPVRELHINTNSPDTASRRPTNINFSF